MKMNNYTISTEDENAFFTLKKRCDSDQLFSESLCEITQAELAFIHEISNSIDEANFISLKIPKPLNFRTLRTHPECFLYIYEDDSLFDLNNGHSVVWAFYYDYLEQLDQDNLTLIEREFFKVN
jgi:hypothetical protein